MHLMSFFFFPGGQINVKMILACLKNNRINVKVACLSSPSSHYGAHVRPVREVKRVGHRSELALAPVATATTEEKSVQLLML